MNTTMITARMRWPLVAAMLTLLLSAAAQTQEFPSRPIKIIVPNPAGGVGDVSARLIGQKLSERLGQPVVVENQPGAAGSIGVNMVKRAEPDGHTLGVFISVIPTIDRIQNKKSTFDIVEDFTPITAIATNPAGMVANDMIPAKTFAEFIEYVRQRPGQVSYGSSGVGTAHYLYGVMLNRAAGLKLVNVPYKGVTPSLNDVLGGHIPVTILSLAAALQYVDGGRLRAFTVFDTARYARLPNVPAVTEIVPNFEGGRTWVGFFAPARLPPPILTRLHEEIVRIINSPDLQPVWVANGLVPMTGAPSEFAAMIRKDTRLWDDAAISAGLIPPQ
jgi:tripartite-type tricarboxylate transporter receptor subunit TctC